MQQYEGKDVILAFATTEAPLTLRPCDARVCTVYALSSFCQQGS